MSAHRRMRLLSISIHALVKRATVMLIAEQIVIDNFNPRPRKEGDLLDGTGYMHIERFQSTPSQRGRHGFSTPEISDEGISIHALAKRATITGAGY